MQFSNVDFGSALVSGVQTVYVTFTNGQPADCVNLNWFTFGR